MLKRPRCDTNEGSETEVTVISDTHKQKEQRNRKEKTRRHLVRAQAKTQNRETVLRHGGAPPFEAKPHPRKNKNREGEFA